MTEQLTEQDIVEEARSFWLEATQLDKENLANAERCLAFLNDDQWNEKHKKERDDQNRPALVLNVLWPPVNQVTNDYSQADIAIEVDPVGDSDEDTADVLQGMIRNIEYESDASQARDLSFFYAVACSRGYRRLVTEYEDDESRNQVVRIEPINDPFSVALDPNAKRLDRSDGEKAIVKTVMTKAALKSRWPKARMVEQGFFEDGENPVPEWCGIGKDGQDCMVAEYWKVFGMDATRVQMATGEMKDESDVTEEDDVAADEDGEPLTRTTKKKYVMQYITNGYEVLEENKWIGSYIPILMDVGREYWINGERVTRNLFLSALGAQVLLNWAATNEAESLALAPRDSYMVTAKEIEGHEKQWAAANEENLPYKLFNPDPMMGNSRPQQSKMEPPIQAASQAKREAMAHVQDIIGLHQQDLGQARGDQSGVAVEKLQVAGDTSTFHFFKNAKTTLRFEGIQIVELIQKVYDTPRQVRIMRPEQEAEVIWVNKKWQDENGKWRHHDLSTGKFSVRINAGPSMTTKRQEAFLLLTKLASAFPQLVQIAGDIIFRNSDVPGAQEIAARLKAMLPPQIAQSDNPLQMPPQVVAQFQQMLQENQQLKQALAAAQVDLKLHLSAKAQDNQTKERIAAMNNRVDLITTQMKHNHERAAMLFKGEMEAIAKKLDMFHESELAPGPDSGPLGLHPSAPPMITTRSLTSTDSS